MSTLSTAQFEAALKAVESEDATPEEKAEMLMEIAMGLQQKPKTSRQLEEAVELYQRALEICPAAAVALRARIQARQGTAYQSPPAGGRDALFKARDCFEESLKSLKVLGTPEEVAEAEMNLGLATQSLAQNGAARIQDAIQSYHRALRTFTKEAYPGEFAILHNNLAIAYLSIPVSDERGKMSEALAVQSFKEMTEQGLFRRDLYYRLRGVLNCRCRRLRERVETWPPWRNTWRANTRNPSGERPPTSRTK